VSDPESELGNLREISPQASLHSDGAVVCVLLPQARLVTPAGVETMDMVLCPCGLAGYVTRLLLERRIAGKPNLNWQAIVLLGRTWITWSWNQVPADLPWIQIFAEHARVLR
jgi:hypothetical protein